MRLLKRCQQLLRGACVAADQGSAFSPSGIRHLESTLQCLGRSADGGVSLAQSSAQWQQLRPASQGSSIFSLSTLPCMDVAKPSAASARLPWALLQARGLFGAVKPKAMNPQNHTHAKYEITNPQPKYDWMKGRFVLDRNGTIWHRQANYRHQRHNKNASQLTRLKRWKPLLHAYTAKMVKVGFRSRYWAPPNPQEVPGAHEAVTGVRVKYEKPKRWSAVPDKNQTTGDPALRQSWKPPPRQRIR